MPKQRHLIEMKILPDLIEIGHFRFERNVFWLYGIGRAAAPALVVMNEMEFVGEPVWPAFTLVFSTTSARGGQRT